MTKKNTPLGEPSPLRSSKKVFQFLKPYFLKKEVEEFWVLALSPQLKPLALEMLFRGTVDKCMVHPRDVFRFAYKSNASSLILAHNHPHGNLKASPQDLQLTFQLLKASAILQVPILDHLILGSGNMLGSGNKVGYLSMADKGILEEFLMKDELDRLATC